MTRKNITQMIVGKEQWKDLPQIPWVKKGLGKEMKEGTHTFQQKVGVLGKVPTMTLLIQMLGSLLQVDM
jgi:hypothetical protein